MIEGLSVELSGLGIKVISVVIQELREVDGHGIGVLLLEKGRGHEHQTVGTETAEIGRIEVVVLQQFLQDHHNWFEISELHAESLDVINALNAQIDSGNSRVAVQVITLTGTLILEGDVHSQIPHAFLNRH